MAVMDVVAAAAVVVVVDVVAAAAVAAVAAVVAITVNLHHVETAASSTVSQVSGEARGPWRLPERKMLRSPLR